MRWSGRDIFMRPARPRVASPLREVCPGPAQAFGSYKGSGPLSALKNAAQCQLQPGWGDGLFQPRDRPENPINTRRVGGIT